METTVLAHTEVKVGDKVFRPIIDRTFEQDIYLMTRVRKAGLDQLAGDLDPGESLEAISFTILSRVFESGQTFELLAGHLVEEGTQWTPARALETAAWFASRTAAADKQVLQEQIVSLVLAFFLNGAARSGISLRSFLPPDLDGESASPTPANDTPAEASSSATSAPSSGS